MVAGDGQGRVGLPDLLLLPQPRDDHAGRKYSHILITYCGLKNDNLIQFTAPHFVKILLKHYETHEPGVWGHNLSVMYEISQSLVDLDLCFHRL